VTSPRSLRSSSHFERFVLDQLADLGPVTSRRMFGGLGLSCRNVFFGIIARDELYLKVDEESRREYHEAGMHAFQPFGGRRQSMQYYCVPVAVLESGPELVVWARKAVAVAQRAAVMPRDRA
jgi:DNA transformation protein and related proteins